MGINLKRLLKSVIGAAFFDPHNAHGTSIAIEQNVPQGFSLYIHDKDVLNHSELDVVDKPKLGPGEYFTHRWPSESYWLSEDSKIMYVIRQKSGSHVQELLWVRVQLQDVQRAAPASSAQDDTALRHRRLINPIITRLEAPAADNFNGYYFKNAVMMVENGEQKCVYLHMERWGKKSRSNPEKLSMCLCSDVAPDIMSCVATGKDPSEDWIPRNNVGAWVVWGNNQSWDGWVWQYPLTSDGKAGGIMCFHTLANNQVIEFLQNCKGGASGHLGK